MESYSTGEVSGSSGVGGLVGYNDGGAVENSFWDNEAPGGRIPVQAGPRRVPPRCRQSPTFTAAGWDFENV